VSTANGTRLARRFAANLRKRREGMDLSQGALAARAGYSKATVTAIERGTRTATLETIEHLAAALNVYDPRKMFWGKL